jgi:ribonuclease HI
MGMAHKKKHFYAVVKGHRPGIYTEWDGSGGAEAQVKGFPGAVHRGFSTRKEAEVFLRSGGELPDAQVPFDRKETPEAQKPAPVEHPDHQPDLDAGKVVIFTDGASTGNPGPGGYGVVLLYGKIRKELSGGFRCTTNNRMELMGVIVALQALKRPSPVVVYSDSTYVVNAIEKGWAWRWRARGWMRDGQNRAENADLWAVLLELLEKMDVDFRWVKGHASHPENERCDRLAVQAARGKNLQEDGGFQGQC